MEIGILGYGEVGKAVASFYKNPFIKDIDRDKFIGRDKTIGFDFLHVCIPYTKNFIRIVLENSKYLNLSGMMIIHSTVPIGTTEKVYKKFPHVAHSPVRGTHPNISEGIRTFVKYIGVEHEADGLYIKRHFDTLGIQSKIILGSRNTEALKLWSTTQYGLSIILEKEMYKWCKENGVNYEVVYQDESKTYNQGFRECGANLYQRPILKHMEGKVGGHCVINNCNLFDCDITKFILEKNKEY